MNHDYTISNAFNKTVGLDCWAHLYKYIYSSDSLRCSAVTCVSIYSFAQCWVSGCNTVSGSAAAWATVMGKRAVFAKVILWQRLVLQTLVQWWWTQRRGGRGCVLWVTRHRHCPCTDSCIYTVFHLHSRLISYTDGHFQCRRLSFSVRWWHQLSSLAWPICQTAVLFIQVCQRPSVTSTHSPMCESNRPWKAWIQQGSV